MRIRRFDSTGAFGKVSILHFPGSQRLHEPRALGEIIMNIVATEPSSDLDAHRTTLPRIPDVPQMTVEVADPSIGLQGFVCIHSMGKYGASGGMRCVPDID